MPPRNPIFDTPSRHPEDTGVGIVGRIVNFSSANIASGFPIGAFEKNTIILRAGVTVITAFNAGTTNTLEIGTAANAGGLVTGANAAAGTVGPNKQGTGALIGVPLPADTVLFAKFTQAGTAATAGQAAVWVEAFVPRTEDPRTRATI